MGQNTAQSSARQQIWQIIAAVPHGCIATYGQIARLAGVPGYARYVGTTLKNLPDDSRLPWHRIVNAQGRLSFPAGGRQYLLQRSLLEEEGIEFKGDKLSLKRYQWRP